eukprot:6714080-Lingulodinium_polyedra.AAC.1
MLDYGIFSHSAARLVKSLEAYLGPCKPHFGVLITLEKKALRANAWTLPLPMGFQHPLPSKKRPDPLSKRTMLRAKARPLEERAQAVLEALEEEDCTDRPGPQAEVPAFDIPAGTEQSLEGSQSLLDLQKQPSE